MRSDSVLAGVVFHFSRVRDAEMKHRGINPGLLAAMLAGVAPSGAKEPVTFKARARNPHETSHRPRTGKREQERRRRQIARGILKVSE
jgi:hypothetical protein